MTPVRGAKSVIRNTAQVLLCCGMNRVHLTTTTTTIITCPICLDNKKDDVVTLKVCNHVVCRKCFTELCYNSTKCRCMLCRSYVTSIEPRVFPDALLELAPGEHVGVTFVNATNGGVVVVNVNPRDAGCRMLQVGDVVTHVNGIVASNSELVCNVLNAITSRAGWIEFCIADAAPTNDNRFAAVKHTLTAMCTTVTAFKRATRRLWSRPHALLAHQRLDDSVAER